MKPKKATAWDEERKLNVTFFFRLNTKDLNRFRAYAQQQGVAPSAAARQLILERLEKERAA